MKNSRRNSGKGEKTLVISQSFNYIETVKNLPANAGDTGYEGLILGLGRFSEKEMAAHSSILAWRISWMEEPGYSLWGRMESVTTERLALAFYDEDALLVPFLQLHFI